MKWLTKSDYLKYLTHPAYLWLQKHAKDKLPDIDERAQAALDEGNLVETYARRLFPAGHLIDVHIFDGPDASRAYLTNPTGPQILFQPSVLTSRRLYARADILIRTPDGWDLYEVKSSTSPKDAHYHDLAFQRLAFEEAGHRIARCFIVHINGHYVRAGAVDVQELFTTVDVTSHVEAIASDTARRVTEARAIVDRAQCPPLAPEHAGFWAHGWKPIYFSLHPDLTSDSIYQLTRLTTAQIKELTALGIERLTDIPDDFPLGSQQHAQVLAARAGQAIIHHDKIAHSLEGLQYPLYLLDYETFASAIPLWDGVRPYQQLPFQYSLHVIEAPGAEPGHREYLARGTDYPVEDLLAHLQSNLGPGGNVIVWHKDFEMGCNDAMAALHPAYATFLESVNARVYDLMESFANGWWADPRFMGSASIKQVLPVLAPELSYKGLGIGEGLTAQIRWMKAARGQLSAEEAGQVYDDLVEYCGQDTWAMVRIWQEMVAKT
jgi:hypothetical protein